MTYENWLLFCSIALVATLSPGPAVLLVTSHSLQYGPHRACITILGNISGLFVLSLCSVLGLSTLLYYSTLAFTIVKTIGAIYLIWLGIRLWRNGLSGNGTSSLASRSSVSSLYCQGVLVALTNPKALAFTTALFPQFIVTSEPLAPQFMPLVIIFMGFSFFCLYGYALISHSAGRTSKPFLSKKLPGRIFGSVFILSGIVLASSSRR